MKSSLLKFSVVYTLDKILGFFSPLILLLLGRVELYASIELLIAFSLIVIPFADLGTRAYLGYSFKRFGVVEFKSLDLLLASAAGIFAFIWLLFSVASDMSFILALCIFRVLHVIYFQYYQYRGRLWGKVLAPIYLNLICNMVSVFVFLIFFFMFPGLSDTFLLALMVVTPAVLFIGRIVILRLRKFELLPKLSLKGAQDVLGSARVSLLFAWPTILNAFLVLGMANYTKIFVEQKFSLDMMASYSFDFRLSMLVFLAHSLMSAYFNKFLILSTEAKKILTLYFSYAFFLVLLSSLVFILARVFGTYISFDLLVSSESRVSIFVYTIFWCMAAFWEVIFIRMGRPKYIVVGSLTFCASLCVQLFGLVITSPADVAMALAVSSFLNLVTNISFIAYGYRKRCYKIFHEKYKILGRLF